MMSDWCGTYQINPGNAGDLMYDDWHEGFRDCDDQKFPQYIGNKAYYMIGWLQGLGMGAGYANIPATVDAEGLNSFIDGYQQAQHERHCHCQETLLSFEDD